MRAGLCEEHPVRAAKFDRRALVDKVECNALRQDEGTSALHVLLDKGRMDWAAGGGQQDPTGTM